MVSWNPIPDVGRYYALLYLKWIDKYIGIPTCYFLSLLPRKRSKVGKANKILVMKFWGLGSIVLVTPALRSIKEKYPGATITFFTLSTNVEICKMYPQLIDKVIFVDANRGFLYFIYDFIRKTILINSSKYHVLFDFEFFTRVSACVAFLSSIPCTVGFHAWHVYRGDLHNINVVFNKYWHVIDNFCNLIIRTGKRHLPYNQSDWSVCWSGCATLPGLSITCLVSPHCFALVPPVSARQGPVRNKQYTKSNEYRQWLPVGRRWPKLVL